MAEDRQKRSSQADAALERPDLGLELEGVGGRQGSGRPPGGGGGYLPSCTTSNFGADARVAELRTMGLPKEWIRTAETIGVDAFLGLWRVWDAEPAFLSDRGDLEFRLRPYRSYLRFQRNRYIEALSSQGMTPPEIQAAVLRELGERISLRHICRIVSGK